MLLLAACDPLAYQNVGLVEIEPLCYEADAGCWKADTLESSAFPRLEELRVLKSVRSHLKTWQDRTVCTVQSTVQIWSTCGAHHAHCAWCASHVLQINTSLLALVNSETASRYLWKWLLMNGASLCRNSSGNPIHGLFLTSCQRAVGAPFMRKKSFSS